MLPPRIIGTPSENPGSASAGVSANSGTSNLFGLKQLGQPSPSKSTENVNSKRALVKY